MLSSQRVILAYLRTFACFHSILWLRPALWYQGWQLVDHQYALSFIQVLTREGACTHEYICTYGTYINIYVCILHCMAGYEASSNKF